MVDILSPLTVDGKVRSKDVSTLDSTDSDDTLAPKGYVDSVSEKKLDTIGGLLTGPLTVEGGANINTSGHIEGTMLRTTADTHLAMAPPKYAVLDSSGWICHRSLDETKSDLGITGKQDKLEAGMNITIDGNTISAKGTTYEVATETSDGLMSSGDKSQLIALDSAISTHVNSTSNPHNVTKSQIGLGDVDNTSDLYKPISIAVQEALNLKADKSEISRIYRPCGSVATINDLPSDAEIGDVYDVAETGMNYAWVEIGGVAKWDSLGMLSDKIDMTNYYTREQVDSTVSGLQSDINTKSTVSVTRSLSSGTAIGTVTVDGVDTTLYCQTNSDTKNTAGSTDTSNKLYLIGATTQSANPQTYSHDTAYVGTDGKLYSGGKVVIASGDKATSAGSADSATKATQDASGNVITTTYETKANAITGLSVSGKTITYTKGNGDTGTITTQDTTYSVATKDANGLMSSTDKSKLDGIAAGANKTTVDSALSTTSTNPVQNKVINSALAGKAGTSVATQSANGLMAADDKKKLDGITAGADAVSYTPALTSGTKVGTLTINGTDNILYCHTNTDAKVTQINDTSSNVNLPILVSATEDNPNTRTNTVRYVNGKAYINPSTGKLFAKEFVGPLTGDVKGNCSGSSGSCTGNSATATKATQDASGNNIVDTYETKANAITGLSVSGRTITYTKGDGSTGTITTQDNNTDTKVTQTNSTGTGAYPILLKNGTGTETITNTVIFDDGVTIQPSTGLLTATKFKGPLEGNVTGNCSGSSGSCTGNSATATKAGQLTTARKIAISGGATGTATLFDGSKDITIPVTALDVSKANAGTLAVARGGTGATNLANVTVGKATALNVSSTSAIAITAGVQFISTTILSQAGNWFIETHVSGANIFQRATSMADPSNVCVRTSSNSGSSWNGWVFSYAVWK